MINTLYVDVNKVFDKVFGIKSLEIHKPKLSFWEKFNKFAWVEKVEVIKVTKNP